ncbi:MAG: hypothetical protein V4598_17075 [Bdellovibrionota bacterium]
MDTKKLSHDIMNSLERLRIMHDLIKSKNFSAIPRDEMVSDLAEEIKKLEKNFEILLNQ